MLDSLSKLLRKKKIANGDHNQRVEEPLPQESEETGINEEDSSFSQSYLPTYSGSVGIDIPKEIPSLENSEEPLVVFTHPHELAQQNKDMWHVGSPPGVHQYRRKF